MHAGERRFAQPAGIYYTKSQNKISAPLMNLLDFHNGLPARLIFFTKTQTEVQISHWATAVPPDRVETSSSVLRLH